MDARKIVGRNIKWWRTDHGETMQQLADTLHVSPTAISRWEKGERNISIVSMEAVCKHYGRELADLVTYRP